MEASDANRLRELEAENAKLKHLLAEAHLEMHAHKSVLGAKGWPYRSSGKPLGRWSTSIRCRYGKPAGLWS